MGHLAGIFVADDAKEIKPAIGKRIYFGEVLGKHSEVECVLEDGHLAALTDDADFIKKAETYGLIPTGFDPLAYITCPDCGDTLKAPYRKCRRACGWKAED
jgi:hypothetical protein